MYPELRLKNWTSTGLAVAIGGWILYLTAYEYLFRGLLLFTCIEAFGLWPAAVINLALYSALHLPKGMKEAIAAIPFGALICYLTIKSGSILPAIFIHVLQAVSCELFCIYRNPEMKFHLLKTQKP
jgi:membrane protease YdiL (CAAX protease family)